MLIQSSHKHVLEYTTMREGELKLGQVMLCQQENIINMDSLEVILKNVSANYIILGIAEDIGVRANFGQAGTAKAYDTFLRYFVNTQSNKFINKNNIFVLGEVFLDDIQKASIRIQDRSNLRNLCSQIDDRVFPIIQEIVKLGKQPIVIGGGHNNAYGNIKGCSLALGRSIDVLNIDPHADFRIEEGRHSGNGFRYAYSHNYIRKYGVWGLNKSYNNQVVLDTFSSDPNLFYESLENIFPNKSRDLELFLTQFSNELGLEIDLDSIKNMPTSAISPIGFTEEEVLDLIVQISDTKKVIYYHLAEGSPQPENAYKVGKFLAYAVTTILKTRPYVL